jgi:hypothetical protein
MAIPQHGRFATQNGFIRVFEHIEPAAKMIYLIDISNQKIRNILERVIGSLSPLRRDTLSYVFQLQQVQQVGIVLQNALHSQKGEITLRLKESMCMRLSYFSSFLQFKKCTAAAYSLWERAFQKMPDQSSIDVDATVDRLLINNSQ